ncbi:MAG: Response regulator PleD [Chlamydiia bacterium]|nr:Response regulator PleD [Chlamydiia bacterium]
MLNTPSDKLPVVLLLSSKASTRVFIKQTLFDKYYVLEVEDEIEALEKLKRTKIEIVIVQDRLMTLSVQDFLRKAREDKTIKHLPILVISGNLKKSYMSELITAGATDFLREPLEKEELFTRIKHATKSQSIHKKIGPIAQSISSSAASMKGKSLSDLKVSVRDRALKEVTKALDNKEVISLLMVDIDNTEKVKARWGELALEELLSSVQKHLSTQIRPQDIITNATSERFVIILPKTSKTAAEIIAEDVQASFKEKRFKTKKGTVRLTISIGVVSLSDKDVDTFSAYDSLETMLETGDSYLKKAKQIGNRIVSD